MDSAKHGKTLTHLINEFRNKNTQDIITIYFKINSAKLNSKLTLQMRTRSIPET